MRLHRTGTSSLLCIDAASAHWHNRAARGTSGRGTGSRVSPEAGVLLMTTLTRINKMNTKITIIAMSALLMTGCASVNMASKEESDKAKAFQAPSAGNAGLYVYRNSFVGKALKKDIWVDGKCLGESASDVFFYTQVEGGKTHKIETESEFSPNALELFMDAGKSYFVRQFIKLGAFVGGADLELMPQEQGQGDVAKLAMAQPGTCGN
jgi:hypothetical protein